MLIVLSSPSGGGKTTVAHKILRKDRNIVRSVSCTTRARRPGEREGIDYFFVAPEKFKDMLKRRQFLESAWVHGFHYGTPRPWVESHLRAGKDVLLVIDVQGGRAVRRKSKDALLLFLVPPSFETLKKRLVGRHSDSPEAVKVRLKDAPGEIAAGKHYDYRIVNDKLGEAVAEVARTVRLERRLRSKD